MKRALLALAAVLMVLVVTNPSREDHESRFERRFRAANPLLGRLGVGRLGSAMLDYRSYGVLSVGRIADEVVSVGLCGWVFTRSLDG